MKTRIKIDSSILAVIIIITVILFKFPQLYFSSAVFDDLLDFIGFVLILKGIFLRMAARAHKKLNSPGGQGLVTSGLYIYTRNPMYLGSFLIGCGFILVLWPWWMLPVFAFLFYLRFSVQIEKEEKHLEQLFGEKYKVYCQQTPRILPKLKNFYNINFKECFNFKLMWGTKERRGLFLWPLTAMVFEMLQEKVIFGVSDVPKTVMIFAGSVAFFGLGFLYRYFAS